VPEALRIELDNDRAADGRDPDPAAADDAPPAPLRGAAVRCGGEGEGYGAGGGLSLGDGGSLTPSSI
jgi:hypothetical protein